MRVQEKYSKSKSNLFLLSKKKSDSLKPLVSSNFPSFNSSVASSLLPPLKWAGGKRWLIPYILPYWQEHSFRRLVEPFCGSLSVALAFRPRKAILNDINTPLIHFLKSLKRGLVCSTSFKNNEKFYYKMRKQFNDLLSQKTFSTRTAELFYYLNRTAYNGLCRFNSKGGFNVPFGRYKKINYKKDFLEYKACFKSWKFSSLDFEKLNLHTEDFIYADPPYDVEFTKYSPQDFSFEDQKRLAVFLSCHKGPVILSNQATPRIKKLYRHLGFKLRFLFAPRRISCNGDRKLAREILVLRNV